MKEYNMKKMEKNNEGRWEIFEGKVNKKKLRKNKTMERIK